LTYHIFELLQVGISVKNLKAFLRAIVKSVYMPVLFLKLFAGLRSKLNLLIPAGKHFHETEQESNLISIQK